MHTALHAVVDLNEQIEAVRRRMVALGERHGFLHPDVMACSQWLDRLLLEYYSRARNVELEDANMLGIG
ncbi:aspartyl-phosphate phosphatase Spo0E family protein [Paenibacillus cymbidii]|uniref:aspartyl-phosphate phosphatase Spo0E family protein n=1 Tax=Paenibacillus cymbidii TaxID=1639034 RepID=UPI001F334330|nr:aspartyl-phosphate phosphatase Spo0E family protein [Paenibacillus cymbidii]